MKKIFLKISLLTGIVVLLMVPIIWRFNVGHLDTNYTRLTTNKAPSLIIGTSRAAQGILPVMFKDVAPQMQNFAFTIMHTPFGPTYFDLISRKLKKDTRNGLFIIAVDPWAVSSLNQEETKSGELRENKVFTSKISLVNFNPNLEYILRYYSQPFYTVFVKEMYDVIKKGTPDTKLHKDGWLEVNVPVDAASVKRRLPGKLKVYQKYVRDAAIQPIRMQYLERTINLLDKHGQVFLVRLPVSKEMKEIENQYSPDFDKLMEKMARKHGVNYLNYFHDSGEYLTVDGNHLYKESGKAISLKLASDIKQLNKFTQAKKLKNPSSIAASN
ncbi:hypothetical protein HUW51_22180 [Adhaeribacter swui]|uniref:Uncharacterized protein n=1 Tax=Adhaeribacter swui TaxID=2086471 RepID=A0A7G7GDQ9_9BACT|nr:hypothetical protein [Adhaeribacter swui]QNF35293.1 hypothetical protein HUW51_22180 [Adhaeribacter swui]